MKVQNIKKLNAKKKLFNETCLGIMLINKIVIFGLIINKIYIERDWLNYFSLEEKFRRFFYLLFYFWYITYKNKDYVVDKL